MNVSKINEGSSVVLLQMDPVFLYNIPNKSVQHIYRASDWNISAPDWYGKLLLTDTGNDSCQVQFKNTNGMFGVAAITKDQFSSSQVFQKVKDSSRYYTVQIQNIVSGDRTVYGIGFMNRKDISQLFDCLQNYFGSQNQSSVADDKCFKYTDHAQVKPDVADGFTKEMEYNDHKKVKVDVKNEATKDVKYTEQAPVKVEIKDEITNDIKYAGHAPIKGEVKDEITTDVKYTENAPIKVDVKDETTKDVKYTAHTPIKMDVKGETTKDVKYTGHAPIKLDVKEVKYAGNAPIKVDVKGETTKDVKFAEHHEIKVKVDIKDGITKDPKLTARTSVQVNFIDKLSEPTKFKMDVKIGQSNETQCSEYKKIELDTKLDVTKKNVTHEETLSLNVHIQDAEQCNTPNSRELASEISKKRKIQSDDSQSDEDEGQIEVSKSPFNIVTEGQDGVTDPPSDDINDNGFLYHDSVTKWFKCHLCPYTSEFRSKMNFLLIHWASTHKIKKPNTCKLCNLVFSTAELRAKHITLRHEKMCSFCAKEFDSKTKLRRHLKELHEPNLNNDNNINHPEPEPEPEPASVQATHDTRAARITSTVPNAPTSSVEVDEKEAEGGILYHDRDTKQFMCHFCPLLTFPPTNQLTFLFQHWKAVHNINEPHTCELCFLHFPTAEYRLTHVKSLHQVCPICSLEFDRLANLTKHLSVYHWNVSSPSPSISVEPKKSKRIIYTCSICSREFETERYLRSHCEAHHSSNTTEQPAENCLVEGEENSGKEQTSTISKKRKLQSESQSGEEQVGVRKSTSNTVTEEQDEVNQDPPSDITDNGIRYHDSATNSFTCHLCPFVSKFRSGVNFLLIHWASSHKIKKPNNCKLCNLIFPTAEIRSNHIISRHEKMCSFCGMEFDTKTKLQSHLKELHYPNLNNVNKMKGPNPLPAFIQALYDQDVHNKNNIKCPDPVSVPAIHESRVAPINPTVHNTPVSAPQEVPESGMSYQCLRTQQFMCIFCPLLKFPLKRKLAFLFQHWKHVHKIFEPHNCQLCFLIFPTAEHRSNHRTSSHQVCPICSREFGRLQNLNKHLSGHQRNVSSPSPSISVEPKRATLSYKCPICSLEFATERFLRFHSEVHIQTYNRRNIAY